jgi:hypothetical protein
MKFSNEALHEALIEALADVVFGKISNACHSQMGYLGTLYFGNDTYYRTYKNMISGHNGNTGKLEKSCRTQRAALDPGSSVWEIADLLDMIKWTLRARAATRMMQTKVTAGIES